MSPKLTVLIPCKNEIQNIHDCIASVRPIADEVLVADSGSSDGTLEIARSLGDRIIEREYVDSGDFKNWAIPQAKYQWVMVVDADERVTPELADEICGLLRGKPARDGYQVRRHNYFLGHPVRYGGWGGDTVTRLFLRDLGRYRIYTDHTEVDLPAHRVGNLKHGLLHYSCWDYETYVRKMLRYTSQQARFWHDHGRRPSLWHLTLNGPMRFLRSYVAERGFLDGRVGLQLAVLTGFYSFLKQAQLWELHYGKKPLQKASPTDGASKPRLSIAYGATDGDQAARVGDRRAA